ncbi:hypothetical protein [Nonomuraea dietziae]|uniref:hypothetical protein n=1 Tax=Nonomuraea dietziae TaxID=65515 RepID=UPI00343C2A67
MANASPAAMPVGTASRGRVRLQPYRKKRAALTPTEASASWGVPPSKACRPSRAATSTAAPPISDQRGRRRGARQGSTNHRAA